MRRFFRELFARADDGELMDIPVEEIEGGGPPPSIYDSLIEGLEGEVAGLKSMIDFHEKQSLDLDATLDHKREQLAVLRAHREEEWRDDAKAQANSYRILDGWKPTDHCPCARCRAARGET